MMRPTGILGPPRSPRSPTCRCRPVDPGTGASRRACARAWRTAPPGCARHRPIGGPHPGTGPRSAPPPPATESGTPDPPGTARSDHRPAGSAHTRSGRSGPDTANPTSHDRQGHPTSSPAESPSHTSRRPPRPSGTSLNPHPRQVTLPTQPPWTVRGGASLGQSRQAQCSDLMPELPELGPELGNEIDPAVLVGVQFAESYVMVWIHGVSVLHDDSEAGAFLEAALSDLRNVGSRPEGAVQGLRVVIVISVIRWIGS